MGRAGIVLGLEVSRLARNNADWHRLLEICALTGTLICDEDGLYDPADFNDRLLLGLKGTMSEAELHFIRARLRGGQLSKARRGELPMPLPVGLVYDPAGKVVLDPDTGVQRRASGTCSPPSPAPARPAPSCNAFNADGPAVPGPGAHRRPQGRAGLDAADALAGAAHPAQPALRRRVRLRPTPRTHDRRRQEDHRDPAPRAVDRADPRRPPRLHQPGTSSRPTSSCSPPTPTPTARDRTAGPAREGPALLQGLAICGRCGRRMTVRYHPRRGVEVPDYHCMRRLHPDRRATLPDRPRRRRRRRHRPPAARHPHPARPRGRAHRAGRTRSPRRRSRRAAPQPRRTRPPPRRPRPPPLPRRRPRQPARRRHPRSRLERRPARPADRPRRLRPRQRRRRTPPSPTSTRPASARSPPTSPPCGPTRPPRSGNANAWPGCSSTTSP